MCSIIAFLLFFFSALFGFGFSSAVQVATVATVEPVPEVVSPQIISCATSVAPETDMENLQALVGATFASGDWTEHTSTLDAQTNATWLSNELGAVAYLQYLNYDCGVTTEQLKTFYSEAGFQTLFENYSSFAATDSCVEGDTRLFGFDAVSSGYDYEVLYWVKQLSPTRAATFMLVFPVTNPAGLAEVAAQLFPELPTCSPAAA